MSLFKKLLLGVIFLLTLVFAISVLLTTLSARTYLEHHLSIKNADNAAALALSMSEKGADYVLMELALSAQFDTGHYELIELTDPTGQVSIRRVADELEAGAPRWFMDLFPLNVEPGVANIQTGWQQAGTLTLRSQSRFVYAELWRSTLALSGIFLLAGLITGTVGHRLLKRLLQPLDEVVDQAEAIGARRFVTKIPEPNTLEFKRVVRAMNELSNRVKSLLAQEANQLQRLQRESHVDDITGLYKRDTFLSALAAALQSNDESSTGTLCIIHITHLGLLNQSYGREPTDNLLRDIGESLNHITARQRGWTPARLNGSDFAVLAPREMDAQKLGLDIQAAMSAVVKDHSMEESVQLPGGTTVYTPRDSVADLLGRIDGVLLIDEREGAVTIAQASTGETPVRPLRAQVEFWHAILTQAIYSRTFSLTRFPVVDASNRLLHYEAPVRLAHQGETLNAGQFLPWIHRLQLSGELDKQVFALALEEIAHSGEPIAVNLSVEAISDHSFTKWAADSLMNRATAAKNLWVEIPESAVFRHLKNFKALASRIKASGGHVGIEHTGHQLAKLGALHDVGLDYLKVDASFVRDIPNNPGNQALLRTLCTVGHTIGVKVLAEGVNSAKEWENLLALGFDGATGPGISLPQ
ncbi:MAG: EAL domain-containing protein [Halioglobus sp.]|nr:EAL domain-containing protein [Halioglobus sp.]